MDMVETIDYNTSHFIHDVMKIVGDIKQQGVHYDLIVGVVRGGLVPATMLSYRLNVPLCTAEWSLRDFKAKSLPASLVEAVSHGQRVLVVDDIIDSGDTIVQLLDAISKYASADAIVDTASLIYNISQPFIATYYGREIMRQYDDRWVEFFWD